MNAAVLRELRVARWTKILAEDEADFGPVAEDIPASGAAEWPV